MTGDLSDSPWKIMIVPVVIIVLIVLILIRMPTGFQQVAFPCRFDESCQAAHRCVRGKTVWQACRSGYVLLDLWVRGPESGPG